jgi:hypothetical protein
MSLNGNSIVQEVKSFIGYPYVYGATGPSNFDCSGLVQYVLTKLGVSNVPRTSEEQYQWATKIQASQLEPGDLVFAQFPGDNASPGHVGVYIGNGQVESARDPALGVGIDQLSSWGNNIVGYGRVPATTPGTGTNQPQTTGYQTTGFDWTLGGIPGLGQLGKLITGTTGSFATIGDAAKAIAGLVQAVNKLTQLFMLLFRPEFWLRVGAFLFGLLSLGAAVYFLKESFL